MSLPESVQFALRVATNAHKGQFDKQGRPYILHIAEVVTQAFIMTQDEAILQAAALHDTLEDTDLTVDALYDFGFSDEVVTIVEAVTRHEGETYMGFIARLCLNPKAIEVKIADLYANQTRLGSLRAIDPKKADSLAERYRKAMGYCVEKLQEFERSKER